MESTTEQLLELGWSILNEWSANRHHGSVKHFKEVMNELEKTQPAPEKILIAFYDWYKANAHVWERHYGAQVRDHLFRLLDIPEPQQRGCCIRFWSTDEEKYEANSLKQSIKKLDEVVNEMKKPKEENVASPKFTSRP